MDSAICNQDAITITELCLEQDVIWGQHFVSLIPYSLA